MPCCGKQRMSLNEMTRANHSAAAARTEAGLPPRLLHAKVFFEYAGQKSMTVIGPVTGKRYRFTGPGAVTEVDLRDRASLAGVPHLKQVR